MRVVKYEKNNTSAVCVTDKVYIEASSDEVAELKKALDTVSRFERLVFSEFQSQRGYAANDERYSEVFKEIYFWFREGIVVASIKTGSIG